MSRFVVIVVSLLGLGGEPRLLAAEPTQRRPPNIVFILADDLGIGHVGCYGQSKIGTPNIDRLAAEGMKFTQFYSGSNVCAPARSTLITGQHAGHTAVRANGRDRHLYEQDITVAEMLKQAGYATGGFGKWGLGGDHTPGVAVEQGFDEWFGQYSQVHAHFYYPYYLMHNLRQHLLPGNERGGKRQYAADEIHNKALAFIEANRGRPFFAYLPYILPHVELVAPAESRKVYEGRWPKIARADPRPGYLGSDDACADFAGMIHHLDKQVGEVMALLKRLNVDDNTVVFFTSDNGPQGGAWTDIFVDFFNGAGPFRGMKGNFYEGGIREPMIARWPGKIRPGTSTDHLGYFPDVLPTLCAIAEVEPPAGIDGISFLPTLLAQSGKQKLHSYLYWEYPGPNETVSQIAIRLGDWKAIKPKPKSAWELYDLRSDVAEQHDVAANHPDIMKRIESISASARTPERHYDEGQRKTAVDFVR